MQYRSELVCQLCNSSQSSVALKMHPCCTMVVCLRCDYDCNCDKKSLFTSCLRCNLQSAVLRCSSCQQSLFCGNCFAEYHQGKLAAHPSTSLNSSCIQNCSFADNLSTAKQLQCRSSLLKNKIYNALNHIQQNQNSLINQIQHQFNNIRYEIQCKEQEIIHKIKQHFHHTIKQIQRKIHQTEIIKREIINLNNIIKFQIEQQIIKRKIKKIESNIINIQKYKIQQKNIELSSNYQNEIIKTIDLLKNIEIKKFNEKIKSSLIASQITSSNQIFNNLKQLNKRRSQYSKNKLFSNIINSKSQSIIINDSNNQFSHQKKLKKQSFMNTLLKKSKIFVKEPFQKLNCCESMKNSLILQNQMTNSVFKKKQIFSSKQDLTLKFRGLCFKEKPKIKRIVQCPQQKKLFKMKKSSVDFNEESNKINNEQSRILLKKMKEPYVLSCRSEKKIKKNR